MKTRHKRVVFIVASLAALLLAVGLILQALNTNIAFFLSPSDVAAHQATPGKTFRIGGLVENGTFKKDSDGLTMHFTITDTANRVPVVFRGIKPDLFKEELGCVAEGPTVPHGLSHAANIIVNLNSNLFRP